MSQTYNNDLSSAALSVLKERTEGNFDALATSFAGASAPTPIGAGQLFYNTSTNVLSVYNGSSFVSPFQASDATLTAIAALTFSADTYMYATGADTFAVGTITSFTRTLLDDADASTWRTTLGLGTMATQNTSSYNQRISTTVDNTVLRHDGTTGAVQTSGVTISDSDVLSAAGVTVTGSNGVASTGRTEVTYVSPGGALGQAGIKLDSDYFVWSIYADGLRYDTAEAAQGGTDWYIPLQVRVGDVITKVGVWGTGCQFKLVRRTPAGVRSDVTASFLTTLSALQTITSHTVAADYVYEIYINFNDTAGTVATCGFERTTRYL